MSDHFEILSNFRSEMLGDMTEEELDALNAAIKALTTVQSAQEGKLLALLLKRPTRNWCAHAANNAIDHDINARGIVVDVIELCALAGEQRG